MKAAVARLAVFLVLAATGSAAAEGEKPFVEPIGNAPSWITVNYYHSGVGDVRWYDIYRDNGWVGQMYSPGGQFLDHHLPPDTAFLYHVCAVYEDGDEACSDQVPARTLRTPGAPLNFDPPVITDISATTSTVTVHWGAIGDYPKILVRLEDDRGNHVQLDRRSVANGSQTFDGLRPGAPYWVALKGCAPSLIDSNCGDWSAPASVSTQPLQPVEPLLPTRPTLKVAGTTDTTITLEFFVRILSISDQRMVLYRDNARYRELPPESALGGWRGTFTEAVDKKSWYRICIEGNAPPVNLCSDEVLDPVWRATPKEELLVLDRPSVAAEALQALAPKPIKKLGKRSCGRSFAGAWSTSTDQNAGFELYLEQQGDQVSGQFLHENPIYNGTLSGVLNGTTLVFTTSQPNVGTGAGEFVLSPTGCQISGRFWADGNPGAVYGWKGSRMN